MKYLKPFQLNESIMDNNFYILYNDIVYVINKYLFGTDEYKIEYLTATGTRSSYLGTVKDIEEDFLPTKDSFNISNKKVVKKRASNKTYDLVYYMGKIKQETIASNVNIVLANGLKKKYSSYPNYRVGELKIVPNK